MIALQLDGLAARDVIAMLARGYAVTAIELGLPLDTVNPPWLWGESNRAAWERAAADRAAEYEMALLQVIAELPHVTHPLWPIHGWGALRGKPIYIPEKARVAASEFADEVCRLAGV